MGLNLGFPDVIKSCITCEDWKLWGGGWEEEGSTTRGRDFMISPMALLGYLCSRFGVGGRPAVEYNGPHGPVQISLAVWSSLVTVAGTAEPAQPMCHMGLEQQPS